MNHNIFKRGMISLALLLVPATVQADEQQMSARVITVPNSPIVLQRCRAAQLYSAASRVVDTFYMNTYNRSVHDALGYTVEYKVYDREGTLIGQQTMRLTFGSPLSNSDPQLIKTDAIGFDLSEEATAVGSMSCKITEATFMGRREWHVGQHWPETLQPMPSASRDTSQDDGPRDVEAHANGAGGSTAQPLKLGKLINSLFGVTNR